MCMGFLLLCCVCVCDETGREKMNKGNCFVQLFIPLYLSLHSTHTLLDTHVSTPLMQDIFTEHMKETFDI